MEKFKKILRLKQNQLFRYIEDELIEIGYKPIVIKGKYIYAEGVYPVMLVSHTDTVHKDIPKHIFHDKEKNVMWSPEGIGGDDRCGVYSMLEIAKEQKPHLLFCADEEIGGVGATCAASTLDIENVKFMIELDRKGSRDAVFYDCGNQDFKDFIESFGFKEEFGSYSDICELSPAFDLASVNLSIGYYNQHSLTEYIRTDEMKITIETVKQIIQESLTSPTFDFQNLYKDIFSLYEPEDIDYTIRNEILYAIYEDEEVMKSFFKDNMDLIEEMAKDRSLEIEDACFEILDIAVLQDYDEKYLNIDTSSIDECVEEYEDMLIENFYGYFGGGY